MSRSRIRPCIQACHVSLHKTLYLRFQVSNDYVSGLHLVLSDLKSFVAYWSSTNGNGTFEVTTTVFGARRYLHLVTYLNVWRDPCSVVRNGSIICRNDLNPAPILFIVHTSWTVSLTVPVYLMCHETFFYQTFRSLFFVQCVNGYRCPPIVGLKRFMAYFYRFTVSRECRIEWEKVKHRAPILTMKI